MLRMSCIFTLNETIAKMKPIYLKLSKPFAKLPETASRFWGNPAMPEDLEWPCYTDDDGDELDYVFVCQINLKELAPYNTAHLLPSSGLLLFFARIDHYLGHFEYESVGGAISSKDAVRIIYLPSTDGLVEKVLVDENDNPVSPEELQISFTYDFDPLRDEDTCLFARPDHRQWETWDHPYEDWLILLQVDSFSGMDFNLNFMDFGVLDFLISPRALRKADFSDVRAIVISS